MKQGQFPKKVRNYLLHASTNTGIAWLHHEDGLLIAIKLSEPTLFSAMELQTASLKMDVITHFHLHLLIQAKSGKQTFTLDCLIRSDGFDTRIFSAFDSARRIQIHAADPDLSYLGTTTITWTQTLRRQLRRLVPQHFLTEEVPSHREQSLSLPDSRSSLRKSYWQHIHEQEQREYGEATVSHHLQFEYLVAYAEDIPFTQEHLAAFMKGRDLKRSPYRFLHQPFWIECHLALPGYSRQHFAVLGFRADYSEHSLLIRGDRADYKDSTGYGLWRLNFIDEQGRVFLGLYKAIQYIEEWEGGSSGYCSLQTCPFADREARRTLYPVTQCDACQAEEDYWKNYVEAFLLAALKSSTVSGRVETKRADEKPLIPQQEPQKIFVSQHQPVIVTHPLLIDRYVNLQRNSGQQLQIEEANKFLWMHSAWAMTEALYPTINESEGLRFPREDIYIELEQPRTVHATQFAACSFLQMPTLENSVQRRRYSLLDMQGKTLWSMMYEYTSEEMPGTWLLPQNYQCPDHQCATQQMPRGLLFLLCDRCQERVTHLTAWLAIALRMIAGDYQEQVDIREPEVIIETSTKSVPDATGGEREERTVLHRFRSIRYFDACVQRVQGPPRSHRGSWMTDRPLAESEFDVNPHALIFVLIQPKDHDRIYRHERFVHMLGRTQHIEPNHRYQPMTIARLREMSNARPITKVYASAYRF